jgi:hypothetical protein
MVITPDVTFCLICELNVSVWGFLNYDVNSLWKQANLDMLSPYTSLIEYHITKILYISDDMGLYPEHQGQNTAMKMTVAPF